MMYPPWVAEPLYTIVIVILCGIQGHTLPLIVLKGHPSRNGFNQTVSTPDEALPMKTFKLIIVSPYDESGGGGGYYGTYSGTFHLVHRSTAVVGNIFLRERPCWIE